MVVLCGGVPLSLSAQQLDFTPSPSTPELRRTLGEQFAPGVRTLSLRTEKAAADQADTTGDTLVLRIPDPDGKGNIVLDLHPVDLYAPTATVRLLTPTGEQQHPLPRRLTYRGHVRGRPDQRAAFVRSGSYLSGQILRNGQRTYLVPAHTLAPAAPPDRFVLYKEAARKQAPAPEVRCGVDEAAAHDKRATRKANAQQLTGQCYRVALGVASDYQLYQDQGSDVQNVINHVATVMLDVVTDYTTDDFDDALDFQIAEQVIATCADCDPWTPSTDPGELLSDFGDWIDGGGFSQPVSMGQLRTTRNFDGSTVGLAWRSPDLLCRQGANHVLQDYTSDPELLRVLTSHEIGHNLNATHDASGSSTIMAPSINRTTSWSAASVTTIDQTVDDSQACLNACAAPACAPVEDVTIDALTASGFELSWTAGTAGSYQIRVVDAQTDVQLYEQTTSSNAPGLIEPPGWERCRSYRVSVATDCGAGEYAPPVTLLLRYTAAGCADFVADTTFAWGTLPVTFTDLSLEATRWDWDFGDGTTSTAQHPTHTYTTPGHYTVRLTVNDGGHSTTRTGLVQLLRAEVAAPYAVDDGGNMEGGDFAVGSLTPGQEVLFEQGRPVDYFSNQSTSWVTKLSGDVAGRTSRSVLLGPEFDLRTVTNPVVQFDLGMEALYCNAPYAMQLQYTTDRGASWTRLGSAADPDWYNKDPADDCPLAAGVFADQTGWLFSSPGESFAYPLDALQGEASVIFRFVFSVAGGYSPQGYRRGAQVDNFTVSGQEAGTAMPVDLLSFSGRQEQRQVILEWETASESDNDHFLIERRTAQGEYTALSRVGGAGTTRVARSYRSVDPTPGAGINYYRLTQVDYDGSRTVYPRVVAATYAVDAAGTVYPNPVVGDVLKLDFPTADGGEVQLSLYDQRGRCVYATVVTVQPYAATISLPMEGLARGVYSLRTRYGAVVQRWRVVRG
ncbi:hypothetical protein LEM8419_02355 [Neolewinella maritima]|uniref:PKD domain-containing protein n=1 Tax=Neolewinella maritima TaxID=1383882 RepID=A0ABM9B2S0_9BACT|nr:hypothetical protein LEM8419_02355 [Neolewinella maritima]